MIGTVVTGGVIAAAGAALGVHASRVEDGAPGWRSRVAGFLVRLGLCVAAVGVFRAACAA